MAFDLIGEISLHETAKPWVELGAELARRGQRLLLIEASSGGAVCAAATAAPGASAWFEGGIVAYSDGMKQQLLSVMPETIANYGAVSAETVQALLRGADKECDWVWAESGIYGPGGARPGKPVGTVYMGLRAPNREIQLKTAQMSGSREQMRSDIQQLAVDFLGQAILNPAGR